MHRWDGSRSAYPGESVFDNRNGFEYWSTPKVQLAALFGFVGLSLLAGIASASVAAANFRGWYSAISQPLLAPPTHAFPAIGCVLAALYLMVAVAVWLVWRRPGAVLLQRSAISLWGWQLALGAAWPAAFFGLHELALALAIAAALVVVLALTIGRFAQLDKTAAILLAPYLAFAAFAAYLNAGFWWLNR